MDDYKKQKKSEANLENEFKEIFSEINEFKVSFDQTPFAQDSAAIIKRAQWIHQIKSDPYIYECYQIINDIV